MPFFSFAKSSRTQVVEKKLITIGPFVERCTPADLENRITLIPLAQAQKSKAIKFRTVIPDLDTPSLGAAEHWDEDADDRKPSTLSRQPHVQKRSVSGSSTATTDSVDTWDADCSLIPEVFDYYVCHKRAAPVEPTIVDDNEDSGDFSIDGDFSEACWTDDSDNMDDMVTIDLDDTEDLEIEEVPAVVPAPQKRNVRMEDILLPLETAFLRPDIRFRPEVFETEC